MVRRGGGAALYRDGRDEAFISANRTRRSTTSPIAGWRNWGAIPRPRGILAIGDGARTDIRGAMGEDMDSLFITGGLARAETRTAEAPDPDALARYLAAESVAPSYAMGQLR